MLEIGSLIDGKYKILNEIGRGGMSVVYMAINEKANKTWAVKEVRKDAKMDFNTVRQGLVAEIETLKKLKHPNLPSIVDVIEDEESFIIVMDYIEGHSLDKIVAENGAQPEGLVVEWAKQLCDVLEYLHTRTPPIIYRDMKPANVMLKPDGNIMVIDFGTAKNYDIDLGETGGIGTIGYAAPEQYIGSGLGRTDARTDIYCLGMTMYHLLTDMDPCKNYISDKSIRAVNPALSRGLDLIVRKCTADKPADRYQSCAELLYDLSIYEDLEPIYKKRQKKKLAAFFSILALSVLLASSGVLLGASASRKATDTYVALLEEAQKSTDRSQKVALYEECIRVPDQAGKKDAYLGLIQTFKERSAGESEPVFTVEEAQLLEKVIMNNREALQQDPAGYTEICFEVGKLFWYYYDYGNSTDNQITRATSSIEWFQDVLKNAPEGYDNKTMANVYANIGIFYRDITTNITEASDKGTYKPLFDNLKSLVDSVAANEDEDEIVRLELIELARSAIQQYATKFKQDGVSREDMQAFFAQVEMICKTISTTSDRTAEMQATSVSLLPNTQQAIQTAYDSNAEAEI